MTEEAVQQLDARSARRQRVSEATRAVRKIRRLQSAHLPRVLGSASVQQRIRQAKRDKRQARSR